MAKLFNPTPRELRCMYAGVEFIFPPMKSVIIKTVRKPGEVLNPDDIAQACVDNLAAVGLQLINEEDPASQEEMIEAGMEALEGFIRGNLLTFNEANLSNANQGLPKLRVPKDVTELQRLFVKHFGASAGDKETTIIGEEVLGKIRTKAKEEHDVVIEKARIAFQAGDFEGLMAALGISKEEAAAKLGLAPKLANPASGDADGGPELPEEEAQASPEAMETTLIEPKHSHGHSPGKPPRAARKPGGPGLRSPAAR